MGKVKKVYKHKQITTVAAAKKLGLKPFIDFYPVKISKPNKKNTSTETLAAMMEEDSPLKSWADLGENAKMLYDTPLQALQVLARESLKITKDKRNPKTYLLCMFLEKEKNKKINKDKKFNKIIDEVLEQCCTYIDVDYDLVDIPKSEMTVKDKNKKHSRQQIIDRVVSKHDRLVVKQNHEFKDWVNNHSHTVINLLK